MQAEGGFIMKLKQFVIVLVTCVVIVGTLIGCTSRKLGNVDSKNQEERILTFLVDSDVSLAGVEAVVELAKKELDMEIIFETRPGGSDGDNIVKTRLASGDMSDILVYNSGALLSALNPEEYFIDLSDESFASKLEPTYAESVSVGDKIYGIPLSSSQAGAILYSKDLYKKYGLEVPKTWDEFILNCDVLYEAGETAIVGTFADSWTSQVPFLADNYNIVSQNPEFVEQFEIGNAKYETTPVALRSFEKLADTNKYRLVHSFIQIRIAHDLIFTPFSHPTSPVLPLHFASTSLTPHYHSFFISSHSTHSLPDRSGDSMVCI